MIKQALVHGLILGVLLILLSVVDYTMGFYGQKTFMSIINVSVMFLSILYFTMLYRDKNCGGYISYAKALGFGTLIALFLGFLSSLITSAFVKKQQAGS